MVEASSTAAVRQLPQPPSYCWFTACSRARGLLDLGAVLLGDGAWPIGPVHYALLIDPTIELTDAWSRRRQP